MITFQEYIINECLFSLDEEIEHEMTPEEFKEYQKEQSEALYQYLKDNDIDIHEIKLTDEIMNIVKDFARKFRANYFTTHSFN
jgi:N-dimethylarginine dimethylaminohydrolase